jgi:hypothetical protein
MFFIFLAGLFLLVMGFVPFYGTLLPLSAFFDIISYFDGPGHSFDLFRSDCTLEGFITFVFILFYCNSPFPTFNRTKKKKKKEEVFFFFLKGQF